MSSNEPINPDDEDLVELLASGFSIFDPSEQDLPTEFEAGLGYELEAERIVLLARSMTRAQAYEKFSGIADQEDLMLLRVRETAKYYCFECLYIVLSEEENK